jgi:hypothetical protein
MCVVLTSHLAFKHSQKLSHHLSRTLLALLSRESDHLNAFSQQDAIADIIPISLIGFIMVLAIDSFRYFPR